MSLTLTTRQKNALSKKGIVNEYQIHRWYPLRYIDNTKITGIHKELSGKHAVILASILSYEKKPMKNQKRDYLKVTLQEKDTGIEFSLMFFQAIALYQMLSSSWIDKTILVAGTLQYHPVFGYSIINPDTYTDKIAENMVVIPVFSKIKGISDDMIKKMLADSLNDDEIETVPSSMLNDFHLLSSNEAVKNVLFPLSMDDVQPAKKRLLFDDLFYFASNIELRRRDDDVSCPKITKHSLTDRIIKSLPYSLTEGQRNTYEEIYKEFGKGHVFRALVQGDVGCGKTIVAFLIMLLAAENGHQAVMMAPTKILASQHFSKFYDLIKGTGISCVLADSETLNKDLINKINDGTAKVVIGTSSLLSDKISFQDPAILVVDEEHKFGVAQRSLLVEKEKTICSVSMSATPIPRTLASAVFGEKTLVYSIKDHPDGKKPIKTAWDDGRKINKIVHAILNKGQQVYVVCPSIDSDDENNEILSTKKALIKYREMCPGKRVEELNGEMSPSDTDKVLSDFRNGAIDILVSTTVVEVGVDVPNANLIIIENAERFGLAGIHQLRGRVGRGKEQGYCILVSKQDPIDNKRLLLLLNTNDGFKIAEQDMMCLRKTGDIFGDEQSGYNKYVSEVIMYQDYYKKILDAAAQLPSDVLKRHIKKVTVSENPRKMKPIIVNELLSEEKKRE